MNWLILLIIHDIKTRNTDMKQFNQKGYITADIYLRIDGLSVVSKVKIDNLHQPPRPSTLGNVFMQTYLIYMWLYFDEL